MNQFFQKYKLSILFNAGIFLVLVLMDYGRYTPERTLMGEMSGFAGMLLALGICFYIFSNLGGKVKINFKKRIFTLLLLFISVFILFTIGLILWSSY